MRICLLTHAFTPHEVTGVENHTAQLARSLAAAGAEVQVFAPGPAAGVWRLSQRLEERDGYEIHWLALGDRQPDDEGNEPGVAEAFGRYLDRERPDLVHAQHLIGLGPGLVYEAKRRGMPFLFTAHDAWLVSEEYRLLRPDFEVLEPSDTAAMARVLLARKLLDRLMPDADHQGLAAPGDLSEEGRALLAEVLDGDPLAAGFESSELEALQQRAEAGRRARLQAVRAMDLVISPTRFLAGVLEAGGVTAPLIVEACGIDIAPFEVGAGPKSEVGAPRFVAFLGGVSKHKGLDDLLDAMNGLEGCELHVHGGSSDRAFSDRCRARAEELGAEWCGPFVNDELPQILGRADVVVVPSKWPENAPFVIREAFAAGVPVVAADVGAMRESIRDGVDGWLYPVGEVDALRERLRMLMETRSLLEEAAAAVQKPRAIEEQVASLLKRYEELLPGAMDRPSGHLEHLAGFTRRYEEVHDMRWDELVGGALAGYASLCEGLTGERSGSERMMGAVSKGSRLRERLAEGERAQAWLESAAADARRERDEVEAHANWQEGDRSALLDNTRWLEGQLKARLDEISALSLERHDAGKSLEAALQEGRRRSRELESLSLELRWIREQLDFARSEAERGLKERDERDLDLKKRTEEVEWLKAQLLARDEQLEAQSTQAEAQSVINEEKLWLREQLKFSRDETKRARRALDERERDLTERTKESEWLKSELLVRDERLVERSGSEEALGVVSEEVRWLREQLGFAREEAKRARRASDERERDLTERTEEAEWLKGELLARDELLVERSALEEDQITERELIKAESSWLRDLLESSELEVKRLEGSLSHNDQSLAALKRETDWLKTELADRDLRLAHSARKLEDAQRATSVAKAEGEHQREMGESAKEEASWRDELMSAKADELRESARKLNASEEACAHLIKEAAWLRETHEALREEISFLGTDLSAREEERERWRGEMERLSNQQQRLLEHELWLRGELRRLLDAVSGAATEELSTEDIAARVSDAVDMLVAPDDPEERP
jgi:glycosyltransferase involved in cell wall biosynthesis